MIRRVARYSGGLVSHFAAARAAQRHGAGELRLLFADTRMEDEDLYRFLIQGAASIFGIPLESVADLAGAALAVPAVEDRREDERRGALAALQAEAMRRVPGLVWVAEGRDPWQVFKDERYIGNSRADPCSKLLKRRLLDRWVRENAPGAIEVFGLDWQEQERIDSLSERCRGRSLEFPMADRPWFVGTRYAEECRASGIEPPRLYRYGFSHNNCGGFCVKAGQAAMGRLLEVMPKRFAYHEEKEQEMREFLGKDVSVLRDRCGGKARTLTLKQFRQRVESGEPTDHFDWGACSCFLTETEGAAA